MELIQLGLAFVAGALAGLWGYRYMLKKNPAKLEAWLAQARAWDAERRNR